MLTCSGFITFGVASVFSAPNQGRRAKKTRVALVDNGSLKPEVRLREGKISRSTIWAYQVPFLVGGFKYFFIFTPKIGKDEPILTI